MAALTHAPVIDVTHRPRPITGHRSPRPSGPDSLPRGYEVLRAARPGRLRISGGTHRGDRCAGRTVVPGEVLGFIERAGTVEPIVAPGRGIVITSLRSGALVHGNEVVVRIAPI